MNESVREIGYEELERCLGSADMPSAASGVHGLFSGVLCGGARLAPEALRAVVSEHLATREAIPEAGVPLLQAVYERALNELSDDAMGYHILMRGDDRPLVERGEDIHSWCEGFLVGFGTALQKEKRDALSSDAEEALRDIVEISRLDADDEDDPELEAAVFEITEYLRMAALMLFAELNLSPRSTEASGDNPPVLH